MGESGGQTGQTGGATQTFEGRLAFLYYEADERPFEPVRNMNVYIDIPHDADFHLFHANTTDTGKLCTSAEPANPDSPARNNMWLEEGREYQVYYEPSSTRTVDQIAEEECVKVTLTPESIPALEDRCVLRLPRWYDDMVLEFVGEGEAPWTPQEEGAEVTVKVMDGETVLSEHPIEQTDGKAQVEFKNLPTNKDLQVEVDGYQIAEIVSDGPLSGGDAAAASDT